MAPAHVLCCWVLVQDFPSAEQQADPQATALAGLVREATGPGANAASAVYVADDKFAQHVIAAVDTSIREVHTFRLSSVGLLLSLPLHSWRICFLTGLHFPTSPPSTRNTNTHTPGRHVRVGVFRLSGSQLWPSNFSPRLPLRTAESAHVIQMTHGYAESSAVMKGL